ncbi:hypothetical protein [Mesorhizobium sp. M0243]|uniref:hypothetical protein n=1 Tax=Mesorhizobium sp. M0243 TaxID=2956925 RepID=UPI00333650A7
MADLRVNRSNDRHGELVNESSAIAELFRLHDLQMKNLAVDIAAEGAIYDPPLVMPSGEIFVVFDGNRRVTCLKLMLEPARAPTQELRKYFQNLQDNRNREIPTRLNCRVEEDRVLIDTILYRRHTGSQKGVGQLDWNDRAKLNFVERTGQGSGVNVASEVERFLAEEGRLPAGTIPWSTLTRLLSSEEFRRRAGFSTAGRRFYLTHDREAVADALTRIATDLANQVVTLGHLWNNEGKRTYLNRLQDEGILPGDDERLEEPESPEHTPRVPRRRPSPSPLQTTFIPADSPHIQWLGTQQRIRAVWEELQSLQLQQHPNAISALMRILLELAMESYMVEHSLRARDTLSQKVGAVASSLLQRGVIDQHYHDEIDRVRRDDQLISVASMQRYIHSPDFAPMTNELRTYWVRLGRFLVASVSR